MPQEPMEAGADAERERELDRNEQDRGEADQIETTGSSGDTGFSREMPERREPDPRLSASVADPYTVEPWHSQFLEGQVRWLKEHL